MLVTISVDISAPPEKVWPFLVEPERAMAWVTALKRYEWLGSERITGADILAKLKRLAEQPKPGVGMPVRH